MDIVAVAAKCNVKKAKAQDYSIVFPIPSYGSVCVSVTWRRESWRLACTARKWRIKLMAGDRRTTVEKDAVEPHTHGNMKRRPDDTAFNTTSTLACLSCGRQAGVSLFLFLLPLAKWLKRRSKCCIISVIYHSCVCAGAAAVCSMRKNN